MQKTKGAPRGAPFVFAADFTHCIYRTFRIAFGEG
jgi:hypothetical protein